MATRIALILVVLLSLAGRGAHAESDPQVVIQEFSDQLLDVMKHAKPLGLAGRAEKLRPAVTAAYDMVAMARATLGVAGSKLSPEDAQKLADAYTRFSVATYADQFSGWNGERFEVDVAQPQANNAMLVPSRIIQSSGQPVAINYLMKETDGQWRIVDVLFDGAISQVAVRRSELGPVFRRDGLDGLIKTMDAKSEALLGK